MGYENYIKSVEGNNRGEIFLFALSTCPWCKKTKALLNELGLEYKYVDIDLVDGDDTKREVLKDVETCNDRLSFPTIRVNGTECIVGFREDKIRDLSKNG